MVFKGLLSRYRSIARLPWFQALLPTRFFPPPPSFPYENMDVPYTRFASDVIKIIQEIADSHFVAFDLEFSGISGHSQQRTPGKPRLQDIYEESKVAATKYQILQFGLTIVKEDLENGQYVVKPYNFNISPVPTLRERQFTRDWSMNSGAVQFLLKNNFDFGLPFTHGVPYLSRAEESQVRMKLSGEYDRRMQDMVLKPEDETLIKHIRDSIAVWQNEPDGVKEAYLNIPNHDRGKGVPGVLNRYQLRLTHQIVQNEFPKLKTIGMRDFVQITNPTTAERNHQKVLQQEHIDREVGRAIGFRWILEAMAGRDISGMPDEYFLAAVSQFGKARNGQTPFHNFVANMNKKLVGKRRVIVGHNCFTDLIFLHHFFFGELPDRVEHFQENMHELFPAVVDTKNIASFGNGRWTDTSLGAVEEALSNEDGPTIVIAPEFDRYASNEKPHEAGYDALLTAKIAIKLSAKMEKDAGYYDRNNPGVYPVPTHTTGSQFGTDDDGYVTASEDVDSYISPGSAMNHDSPILDRKESDFHDKEDAIVRTGNLSVVATSRDTSLESTTLAPTDVIAVRETKPKPKSLPHSRRSISEVEKVRGVFAATNIYDVLGQDTDANVDQHEVKDLMAFSDPESPSGQSKKDSLRMQQRLRIEDLVKQGKLMPRWDGGNGFWQLFGNKLQVNSSKEGVCDLSE